MHFRICLCLRRSGPEDVIFVWDELIVDVCDTGEVRMAIPVPAFDIFIIWICEVANPPKTAFRFLSEALGKIASRSTVAEEFTPQTRFMQLR